MINALALAEQSLLDASSDNRTWPILRGGGEGPTTLPTISTVSSIDDPSLLHSLSPSLASLPARSRVTSTTTLTPALSTSNYPIDDQDDDDKIMSSSIHALYRPIAARRRALLGQEGEIGEAGIYVSSQSHSVPSNNEAEGEHTMHQDAGIMVQGKKNDAEREMKLAEKLQDIFGLESDEAVIAGTSHFLPWCIVSREGQRD